jgi:hypothetical protein
VLAAVRVEALAARARAAQRIAHQAQPLRPARAQRELEHLRPDVHEVADDLGRQRRVREREAGQADLAVVHRRHGVEQVRRAAGTGARGRTRLGRAGAAVAQGHADAGARELGHQLRGPRQLGRERQGAHAAPRAARGAQDRAQRGRRGRGELLDGQRAGRGRVHEGSLEVQADDARARGRRQGPAICHSSAHCAPSSAGAAGKSVGWKAVVPAAASERAIPARSSSGSQPPCPCTCRSIRPGAITGSSAPPISPTVSTRVMRPASSQRAGQELAVDEQAVRAGWASRAQSSGGSGLHR